MCACTCFPVGCISQETLLIALPDDVEALGLLQVSGCRNEVCWIGHAEPPFNSAIKLALDGGEDLDGISPYARIFQERDGNLSLQFSWQASDPTSIREGDRLGALVRDETGAEIASG